MEDKEYRNDIDGLRAISVLLVMLYHFDVLWLKSGFIGVDIFFVISGYLITKNLVTEYKRSGNINFKAFYLKRARRLLPALIATLLLSSIVALLLFPEVQLKKYFHHQFFSILSLANFSFWNEAGYFDNASITKPLLHIWSLSVEEQFYIIWPLLIYSLYRLFKIHFIIVTIATMALLSFIANLYLPIFQKSLFNSPQLLPVQDIFIKPDINFFMVPFRVFEFSIGALIIWIDQKKIEKCSKYLREILVFIGIFFVIYSANQVRRGDSYPNYHTLIPCVATALIIIFSNQNLFFGKLLSIAPMRLLGKLSYTLYLVHWPIAAFYKYYQYDYSNLKYSEILFLCILSLFISVFIYNFIEQKFRYFNAASIFSLRDSTFVKVIITSILFGALVSLYINNNSSLFRQPHEISASTLENEKYIVDGSCKILDLKSKNCFLEKSKQILTFGDSHHYLSYNIFSKFSQTNTNINVIDFGELNNCEFTTDNNILKANGFGLNNKGKCNERASALSNLDLGSIDIVAISSFTIYQSESELILSRYIQSKNPNIQFIIIEPYIGIRPYRCIDIINRYASHDLCKNKKFVSQFGLNKANQEISDKFTHLKPFKISQIDLLCKNRILDTCITQANNTPMFYDGDHYTQQFSLYVADKIYEHYKLKLTELGILNTSQ